MDFLFFLNEPLGSCVADDPVLRSTEFIIHKKGLVISVGKNDVKLDTQ